MGAVLQFSGGKDSLACLFLLRERWPDITVLWMNTGATFPEVQELMASIRDLVPNFVEVRSDVLRDIGINGWPVDVLPTKAAPFARDTLGTDGMRMRPWFECCSQNIWLPMANATRALGATTVIRGQRNDERYKGQLRHGQVVDGVRYEYPIETWTERQVFAFLHKEGVPIPSSYSYSKTSLGCWNCTAYLDEEAGRLEYMRHEHPGKRDLVMQTLRAIREEIDAELRPLEMALG